MIQPILTYPKDKDILTQTSEEVKDIEEVKTLIQDLKDTLHNTKDGKGISAIQIGIPKKVCICSWAGQEIVMINPKITRTRGEQLFSEGCLSAPGKYAMVTRYQKVWCEYMDENGEIKTIDEGGRMSNIIQHELDHFNGACALFYGDNYENKN